jgi:hypothetical protein
MVRIQPLPWGIPSVAEVPSDDSLPCACTEVAWAVPGLLHAGGRAALSGPSGKFTVAPRSDDSNPAYGVTVEAVRLRLMHICRMNQLAAPRLSEIGSDTTAYQGDRQP